MMTVSWKIYIRVRGESLSSLRETYEKLDNDGRDNLRRTGKVWDISTSWFESAERNEIGIEIDAEVPDQFNDMNEREQEDMICELLTGAYVEPWLGWFRDDLDDEDWSIFVCYDGGEYRSFGDGYYDGSSPKEILRIVRVSKYDIDHIHVYNYNTVSSPNKDSKNYVYIDDDDIEINDVFYDDRDGVEYINISMSGEGIKHIEDEEEDVKDEEKYVKDEDEEEDDEEWDDLDDDEHEIAFECLMWMPADEFSEIYRRGDKYGDYGAEFTDGEITIKDKKTNKIEKWKLNYYNASFDVNFN